MTLNSVERQRRYIARIAADACVVDKAELKGKTDDYVRR